MEAGSGRDCSLVPVNASNTPIAFSVGSMVNTMPLAQMRPVAASLVSTSLYHVILPVGMS